MSRKNFKTLVSRSYEKDWIKLRLYDFSAYYDVIAVDDILDIQKYLMKKNNMI